MTKTQTHQKHNEFEERVREIITYHSDDGTSGYLLDDARIEKIVKVIQEAREDEKKKLNEYIDLLKMMIEEYKKVFTNS